jgi:PKD repeat protein
MKTLDKRATLVTEQSYLDMKKRLLLLASLFLFLAPLTTSAQCTIDYNYTVPGLYPDTLPDGYVGQFYSEDVTFVLPLDTQGFPFTNFKIQAITGMPFGMTWACNAQGNGCNYDPAVSQHGCANFSGTPILPGSYVLEVYIIATLGVLGDFPTYYYTPLVIHPDTSSNAGFGMTNAYGCAPVTVSFTNGNPGLLAYTWDFGNGSNSTAENPPPQIYTTPGTYVVDYAAFADTNTLHYLTEVQVLGVPNNWGWPGDLNPDIYVELWDATPTLVYTSGTVQDQDPPVTFAIPNILLANETYTVHVWDEDGGVFGADDDLGSTTFAGHGGSGAASTGSTSIAYTIAQLPPIATATATDTVFVFGYPNPPNIDSLGNLLWTDSVNLDLQWYANGNAIAGADSASYPVTTSGDYWVVSNSPAGCFSSSDTISIVVCDTLFQPGVSSSGHVLFTDSTGNSIQWFLDGSPIAGENSEFMITNSSGDFHVQVTTFDGCVYSSDMLNLDFTGITDHLLDEHQLHIFPNPNNGQFNIELYLEEGQAASYQVLDMVGNEVTEVYSVTSQKHFVASVDLSHLPAGIYLVRVQSGPQQLHKKVVIR